MGMDFRNRCLLRGLFYLHANHRKRDWRGFAGVRENKRRALAPIIIHVLSGGKSTSGQNRSLENASTVIIALGIVAVPPSRPGA